MITVRSSSGTGSFDACTTGNSLRVPTSSRCIATPMTPVSISALSISPVGAMFHDPIQQRYFKADVFPGFFALDPLVLQNFCALREELLVKRRFFNELRLIGFRRRHVRFFFHKIST